MLQIITESSNIIKLSHQRNQFGIETKRVHFEDKGLIHIIQKNKNFKYQH